jgi:hypothetical protein
MGTLRKQTFPFSEVLDRRYEIEEIVEKLEEIKLGRTSIIISFLK